jgi:hypothetical protein
MRMRRERVDAVMSGWLFLLLLMERERVILTDYERRIVTRM